MVAKTKAVAKRQPVDAEMAQFQADLLQSIRELKAGQYARVTQVPITPAAQARAKVGLSQASFSKLLGVSVRTLQEWEQGRREPTGAAQTLLKVAQSNPKALLAAMS